MHLSVLATHAKTSAPIGASKCYLSLFLEIMPNITTDRSTDMRGHREVRPETRKQSSNKTLYYLPITNAKELQQNFIFNNREFEF